MGGRGRVLVALGVTAATLVVTAPSGGALDDAAPGPQSIAARRAAGATAPAGPRGFVQVVGLRQRPGPAAGCSTLEVTVANRSDTGVVAVTTPTLRTRIFNPMYPGASGDGSLLFRDGPEVGPFTRSVRLAPFATGVMRLAVCLPEGGEPGDHSVTVVPVTTGYRWLWSGPGPRRRVPVP